MEAEHVLETAKDARGARVIEAFLASDASTKQKRRLVVKYVYLLLWQFYFFQEAVICACNVIPRELVCIKKRHKSTFCPRPLLVCQFRL